ncbi:MAG TPA: type II secretion system F family protein [Burkholderiales bacterium]
MLYRVKALRKAEGVIQTVLEAPSMVEVQRMARSQGLQVLSVAPQQAWLPLGRGRRQVFPLVLFSQEMATLLKAGLSLIDAIESLAEKETQPEHRKVLQDMARYLYEGKSFSQALQQFQSVFPELYVALVQSSERTGELQQALARYVAYQSQVDQVKKKIVSASVYPVLLLVVGGAVLLFLLGYVVPRFSQVYEDMGTKLPWTSRLLMLWGTFLQAHYAEAGVLLLALLAGATYLVREEGFRERLGRLLERVPAIRRRLFLYHLARFYRSLGMLLKGGIPILPAINMVKGQLNTAMRTRLEQAAARVREGVSLSNALEGNELTTPVALRMLRAGEHSGNLGEMLERTAEFYDEEMARWVDWFIKLFEPILMTVIGVVIGVVVVLMYIPIFELASSIQ